MAKVARTEDGSLYCSNCSSAVDRDSRTCPACEESLEGEFEAMVCPDCGGLIKRQSDSCPICGHPFKKRTVEERPKITGKEDEFLSKLIEWGQGRKQDVETKEDILEKEQAANVLLKMQRAPPKPEQFEFEGDVDVVSPDERPQGIGAPLDTAVSTRKDIVEGLIKGFSERRRKLEKMKEENDPAFADELLSNFRWFEENFSNFEKVETAVENLRQTYTTLIVSQRDEVERKEHDFNLRLKAFKKELARRNAEKRKLEERAAELDTQEINIKKRIKELDGREELLIRKEEALKSQIEELRKKDGGRESPSQHNFTKEQWLEDQKKIQSDLMGLREQGKQERDVRKRLEEELEQLKEEKMRLEKKIEERLQSDGEIIELLKVLDDLLEDLPEDVVDKFARSKDYKLYEKVLDRLGI